MSGAGEEAIPASSANCGDFTMKIVEDVDASDSAFAIEASTGKITVSGDWPVTGATAEVFNLLVEVTLANTPKKKTKEI